MSLTSDYLKHVNKKKKKEDKTEAPVYVNKTAPLYASDDIAPVFVNKTAPLYLPVAPVTKATPKGELNRGQGTKQKDEDLREASWWDSTVNSAKRGYYNALYGEESFAAMEGRKNYADVYKKILEGDEYQFEADGWAKKAVSGAAELLGQMGRQFTNEDRWDGNSQTRTR